MSNNIAEYIKGVRKKLGLTQEQFADAIGVSFPTVNRWENGKFEPLPLAMKAVKELEVKGVIKISDPITLEEIVIGQEYHAVFRGRIIYVIKKERRYGLHWVVRYITSKRIADKAQYLTELHKRLQERANKRTNG